MNLFMKLKVIIIKTLCEMKFFMDRVYVNKKYKY